MTITATQEVNNITISAMQSGVSVELKPTVIVSGNQELNYTADGGEII